MSESEISVTPLNAQVVLFASEGAEFPEWVTGEEPAVATDSAIMVATREDLAGDVTVRVLVDEVAPQGEKVFEHVLSVPTRSVRFGSFLSGELAEIPLPDAGEYIAQVYVDDPAAASAVFVLLDRREG
ncbi:hypothetical protein QE374_001527 [Microbacterium sp. SORGH_AS428]|uniref:hypothetical protein n=1 Tax=Microbacterium sp. SORGH_AS_0428 TaxID=3041788 RepID=UPI0028555002|nr:hypothetical protein [Microbacterium sp. SORGH_AS_0428]MDR6199618.1 hypothetical protein [Microbacterium sp. SORGH_AS_0428]